MEHAITACEIYKDYAGEKALVGVNLTIPNGCLYGLIGADGAGKTTLMQIFTTLLRMDSGSVSILGYDLEKKSRQIRIRVGYMPQKFSLYHDLTVMENINFFADIFGITGDELKTRIERLLEFSRLGSFKGRRASHLSGGMKQKLALCCSLIHSPDILFLDEPTIGVDPASRLEFWKILRELVDNGHTIMVSTPYMEEAEYCDRLTLLHHGKAVKEGTPEEIRADYPLRIFLIEGENMADIFRQGIKLAKPIRLIYPAGGDIRIAVDDDSDMAAVLSQVRSIFPSAVSLKTLKPEIEDVFIHLLDN